MNNVSTDPIRDPDFLAAMREVDDMLKGSPSRYLALPAPRATPAVLTPFSVPVIRRATDPESRADVLSRVRITKTVQPGIRDVTLDGEKIGRIAACPWGPGWFASCTRSRLYSSMDDAALALVQTTT